MKPTFTYKTKVLIFFINLFMLVFVALVQYNFQIDHIQNKFKHNIENIIIKEYSNNVSTTKGVINSLSSYYQSTGEMNSSSFSLLASDLLNDYKYMNAIAFATVVLDEEKESFKEYMVDSGFFNFEYKYINEAYKIKELDQKHTKYAPIIYIEPASFMYTKYFGFDIYNDDFLHRSFTKASRSDDVVIKDKIIVNKNADTMNLFIKATYKGEVEGKNEEYKFNNTNGFYIISVDIEKLFLDIKSQFKDYKISIVSMSDYKDYIQKVLSHKKTFFKELKYFNKIEGFENSYFYISKQLTIKDFNIFWFTFIILLVILVQILYVLVWHKDRTSKNQLNYKATHDDLTGLANRTFFKQEFLKIIEKTNEASRKTTAVLFIDVDRFKEINDSLGHKFGDEVLVEIASRFKKVLRSNDLICRHGGDEFLILIDQIENINYLYSIVKKIMASVSQPISYDNNNIHLTISVGISLYPNDGNSVDDLLKNADSAMYKAKDEGRNTFMFYTEDMTLEIVQKVFLENKLRTAIVSDEFLVYFQPQYDAKHNKLIGMEALVRWENKEEGLISPGRFIPIAEETGLIVELDRLVLKKAIEQFSLWKEKGFFTGTLSLNLSMKQLKSKDFNTLLKDTIMKSACNPKDIELEVTEGQIMENPLESIEKLKDLNAYGIKLSVDDFGTGYSSLAYLKKLPINKLKIDRAFVKDLPEDEEDIAITSSIIALARSLKLEIIAEGVENEKQKDFLIENGCTKIQGYYFSKPISAQDMEKLLSK